MEESDVKFRPVKMRLKREKGMRRVVGTGFPIALLFNVLLGSQGPVEGELEEKPSKGAPGFDFR
jgi:hypothetical protein